MYAKLFGLLLFAIQIILNGSSVVHEEDDLVASESASATVPEGYVAFPEDHVAYKIYKEHGTWNEARHRCIARGAHLAIPDSFDKVAHINSLKTNWRTEWLHVGIHKSNVTHEWVRVDNGLPITSVPWRSNNPDDSGNCTAISLSEAGLLNLYCNYSSHLLYYVCEIPLR